MKAIPWRESITLFDEPGAVRESFLLTALRRDFRIGKAAPTPPGGVSLSPAMHVG